MFYYGQDNDIDLKNLCKLIVSYKIILSNNEINRTCTNIVFNRCVRNIQNFL